MPVVAESVAVTWVKVTEELSTLVIIAVLLVKAAAIHLIIKLLE